ncbi:MAG: hypothetical protein FWG70_08120 [Oscillospiraceae bacterium]|nr:hypothetical protein [Oscillospiraceae bacterium]
MENMSSEKSNIKLKSNLMLKSRIGYGIGTSRLWYNHSPADLFIKLFPYYRDKRMDSALTQQQRDQKNKALFFAKEIVDIE